MINQNRTGTTGLGSTAQKKLGGISGILGNNNQNSSGLSGCLKIKNTAITQPTGGIANGQQQNFVKDMKKHGIIKDIHDVG